MRRNFWVTHRVFWCFIIVLFVGATFFLSLTNDIETMLYVGKHRTKWANLFFVNITKLGEHYLYIIFGVGLIVAKNWRLAVAIGTLGITVLALSFVLKMGFGTPRPAATLRALGLLDTVESIRGEPYHFGNTSFPSGHTMSAFALFGFLALLRHKHPRQVVFLLLVALCIGLSRIYLLQHFPTDAFAGAIIGVFLALTWFKTHNYLQKSSFIGQHI